MTVAATQEFAVDLATVWRSIQGLSSEHREILMLVCVKELRYEEISELLQVPVGTVRSRVSRARQKLNSALAAKQDKRIAHNVDRKAPVMLN